jgi:GTP-binding protein
MLDYAAEVMEQMELHVPTSTLNKAMADAFEYNAPPAAGRSRLKLYYSTMIGNEPPRFALFVNDPKYCPANYFGYLVNYLRRCFDFTGLPIELQLRARPKREFVPSPKPKKKKDQAKLKKKSTDKKDKKGKKPVKKQEAAKKKRAPKKR